MDCFPSTQGRDEIEMEPDLESIVAEVKDAMNMSVTEVEEWLNCDIDDSQATELLTDEAIIR